MEPMTFQFPVEGSHHQELWETRSHSERFVWLVSIGMILPSVPASIYFFLFINFLVDSIWLYVYPRTSVGTVKGSETPQGQQYQQSLETKPTTMRVLNAPATSNHGANNGKVLFTELLHRTRLLMKILFIIGFGFIPSLTTPLQAMLHPSKTHFHPACVVLFFYSYLTWIYLFLFKIQHCLGWEVVYYVET